VCCVIGWCVCVFKPHFACFTHIPGAPFQQTVHLNDVLQTAAYNPDMLAIIMDALAPSFNGLPKGHRGLVVKHAAAVSFWLAVHCPKG
jgi:hypothetical protein